MKKCILFVLAMLTYFSMEAQEVKQMINDMNDGQRLDTIIQLDPTIDLGYVPLTIIKGQEKGPVFTIVAGVHGFEYPPIVALQQIIRRIKPEQLRGTLVIIPIANVASFYKRSPFVNPIDSKNLNTVFPGSSDGTLTDKIAHWITSQIIPISEVFLDIHAGDASEDLLPFVCYYENHDSNTDMARRLSQKSGFEYIVSYPYNITKDQPAKYAFKQAVQDNKVALSIEAGKLGNVQEEAVKMICRAVEQMLEYMDMYTFNHTKAAVLQKQINNQTYIRVPQQGLFYSTVKSGDSITKFQNLGYITDEFGNILEQIVAPEDGIVLYKIGTPAVNVGETLFCIGIER